MRGARGAPDGGREEEEAGGGVFVKPGWRVWG